LNGDPFTLDLYRNPSSRILVVVAGFDMPEFYRTGSNAPNRVHPTGSKKKTPKSRLLLGV
jgi:hypothetical protein